MSAVCGALAAASTHSRAGTAARVERTSVLSVTSEDDAVALEAALAQLGWRVYVTNQPAEQLSLEQRGAGVSREIHRRAQLGRFKGQPLSLQPMYVKRDDHAVGLVRLLSLRVRVLTLLEYVARRHMARAGASVAGLYEGQPTRRTTRPTTGRLLAAFRELTLTFVEVPGRAVCHLSPLHERLLALLVCSPEIYLRLVSDSSQPP